VAFPYALAYGDGTPYVSLGLGTLAVPVANQAELDSKVASLQPGQKLVLGAGAYTNLNITGKSGTQADPISVVAQAVGGPKFSGNATIKDCAYLTVSGVTWPQDTPGDTFGFRGTSHHCRLVRCTIGPTSHPGAAITTEAGNYIYVGDDCHTIDIGYNELRNKARAGNGVRVYGNFTTYAGCKRVRVHHNYIHDFYPAVVNDFEAIRYGVSTMSRTDSFGIVERNVLENIRSEPELISGKMGSLRVTGNVAKTCSGSMVIRHGRNCILADNYCVDGANTTNTNGEKSGGYRFYDSGHLVERNYGGGLAGTNFQDPLIIDSGDVDSASTSLSSHFRVVGATVQGNVLYNCPVGVTIGNNYSLAPVGITVRGNAAVAVTSGTAVTQRITPESSTVDSTNVYYSSASSGGFTIDADGIARKSGYGPRLTYLKSTDVGVTGDLAEGDGTGAVLTGSQPTPGTTTTTGGSTGTNTGSTGGTTTTTAAPVRTLGVGGIPAPAAGPNVTLITSDSTSGLTISSSGTSTAPKIWDGGGHSVGRITINASWVIVQNFRVNADGQYGIYSTGKNVVIANNDIRNIHGPGDLNAITFFGDGTHIIYNTAIDFISGDPGDSHTDAIQTWDTSSKQPSSNVVVQGNKFSGPSRSTTSRVIHQCIMAEGPASTDGGGGGAGPMANWLVLDNYFKGSWNQEIKFDDVDNVQVSRNTFAGDSTKICEVTSLSSGFKYYSDNIVTGSYSSGIGVSVTSGAGPLGPYPPGAPTGGGSSGGGTTDPGTTQPPGVVSVGVVHDMTVTPGQAVFLTAGETNTTSLTITSRKWELLGTPSGNPDPTVAADRLGWGTPTQSDEFNYSGAPDSTKWLPSTGGKWDVTRGTVDGSKLAISGSPSGQTLQIAHRFGQQYGRWECRMRSYAGSGPKTYQYYRFSPTGLRDPAVANSVQLSEFALLNGATRLTGMTATATNNNSPIGQEPDKAADNNLTTKWLSFNKTASELVYNFGSPVTTTGYRWATANDSPDRDPVSWTVYGSTNGTSWTALDARSNFAGTTSRNTYNPDFSWGTAATTGGTTGGQTLGVGGVAAPPGAILETQDRFAQAWTITSGGTAANPKVYDGQNHTVGRVTVNAEYVVVQNYRINPQSQYAVVVNANNFTLQNCDLKGVKLSGDGDLNAITLFGSNFKCLFNTAINYVDGDPGSSHTDFIQTWVSSSHPNASSDNQIIGNKVTGPANPSRNNSIASIHQLIMVESAGHGGNSGGSGTPSNWLIADNEWGASWGQDVKLDCGNNFVFTRNKWVGSSDRIFAFVCGSGNVVYSDNIFGSGYGQVGASVTSGSGPGTPPTSTAVGGNFSPVLGVWPDSNRDPEDGAYYFSTNDTPGEQTARAQMFFPRDAGTFLYRQFTKAGVDWTQFHNIALEWTSTALTGYVDGVQFFTTGGGATTQNRDIQTMPSGHLLIGLSNPTLSSTMNPATMEVDWTRVYSLTPQGTVGGGTTLLGTTRDVNWTAPLTVGTYVLRYTVTLSDATTRSDDMHLAVSPAQPGAFFPPGIPSEEMFGQTTKFFTGSTAPQLTYPGLSTFPGPNTFPGLSGTASVPPEAQPGSFSPYGIPSEEAFGVTLQFSTGTPALLFVPPGIPSEEAFGQTTAFSAGAEPTPAVGGVFVPSLWAIDKNTGATIPLPKWSKITVSRPRQNLGAITIDYPADAIGFSTLAGGVQANPPKALEFRIWLGGNATGALGGWLVAKSATNRLVPGGTWTFTGHFHEWLMTKAVISPQDKTAVNPNGEMVFAGATYGSILLTVVQQAQLRRALPYVACDFTSSKDSNGQPWASVVTNLRFPPKTTLMQVADKGVDLGIGEYYMTGARVLRAFNPGTRGVDRSVTTPPLVFAQTINLREFTQRESSRDAGTAVLAAGSEGFYAWGTNLTAEASLGFRAEVGVDGGNITSQVGVDTFASLQAQVVSKGVAEYASGIEFRPGDPLPLLHYDVGDVAVAVTGTDRIPSRIEQIDLSFEPGKAPSGTVAQNNLVVDKLAQLYRLMNALTNGDAVVGTSTATPGGQGEDHIPPAAPTGLVVESNIAYQNPGDVTVFAMVTVGWLPVTTDAPGSEIPIVQAAQAIYDRFAANLPINEDWTWTGCPQVVSDYNDLLLAQYTSEHGTDPKTWLNNYLTMHGTTGAVTDDVDHYRVQFRYLGPVGVGFGGTSEGAGLRDPNLPIDPTDLEFGWGDAPGSPTTATELVFGEVVGGRLVGVRVAAVDRSGNQSAWSTELDFLTAVDNTPPPTPSTPVVSASFRTMNITWDGKGSQGEDLIAAAPDFLSGGGLEIHVGTAFNFVPHRPVTPDGALDLAHSTTFQRTIYGPGTWNVSGLSVGVTYYARFVAVDNNGNASVESACSVGVTPDRLVQIDLGPNAVGREQIIDLEVVRAKIADGAINSLKVEEISAGLISTGTMQAQVALAGMFYTPPTVNGNRVEFDAAGIRLYRGGTIVGRWQVQDASMLNTGQSQTAVTGQRLVMNPNGSNPDTMRFYPSFSDVYSSIDSVDWGNGQIAGIRIIGSANPTTTFRGMCLIRDQFASLVHGRQDLTYWGSEMWVEEHFTRNKSAAVDLVIDERLTAVSGPPRVAMICYDTNGFPINATGLYYKKTAFNGGEPQFYGNGQDCAIIFAPDGLKIRNNPNADWRDIWYAAAHVMSGRDTKSSIRGLDIDATTLLRGVQPKRFHRRHDKDDAPDRMGFVAEDMPYPVRVTSVVPPTDPSEPPRVDEAIDYSAVTALLWAATQQIDARLSTLEDAVKKTKDG
jgi:hypothetical protein